MASRVRLGSFSWGNGSNPYANASLKSRVGRARHQEPHLNPGAIDLLGWLVYPGQLRITTPW